MLNPHGKSSPKNVGQNASALAAMSTDADVLPSILRFSLEHWLGRSVFSGIINYKARSRVRIIAADLLTSLRLGS